MSDIEVFDQSRDSEYVDELGVEVFTNEVLGTTSDAYHFNIHSDQDDSENSLSGMWMRIVLNFN